MTPPRGAGRASVASVKRTSLTEMLNRRIYAQTIEIVPGTPQFNHSTQAQLVRVKPASREVAADNSPS